MAQIKDEHIIRRCMELYLNQQNNEIDDSDRMGRVLFKRIAEIKESICAKIGVIKDKESRDPLEKEDTNKTSINIWKIQTRTKMFSKLRVHMDDSIRANHSGKGSRSSRNYC